MQKNSFSARAPLWTPLGDLTMLPNSLIGRGELFHLFFTPFNASTSSPLENFSVNHDLLYSHLSFGEMQHLTKLDVE